MGQAIFYGFAILFHLFVICCFHPWAWVLFIILISSLIHIFIIRPMLDTTKKEDTERHIAWWTNIGYEPEVFKNPFRKRFYTD